MVEVGNLLYLGVPIGYMRTHSLGWEELRQAPLDVEVMRKSEGQRIPEKEIANFQFIKPNTEEL